MAIFKNKGSNTPMVDAADDAREPRENIFYINFQHKADGLNFKLGAIKLSLSQPSQKNIIEALQARGQEGLDAMQASSLFGEYNAGTGDNADSHYINLGFIMAGGARIKPDASFIKLVEGNPKHEAILDDLVARDQDAIDELLANAVLTFNPAVPQEHAVGF